VPQVLAKSCKPVPVMLMGACRGKKYPMGKYANVAVIVTGVALFMGGGSKVLRVVGLWLVCAHVAADKRPVCSFFVTYVFFFKGCLTAKGFRFTSV